MFYVAPLAIPVSTLPVEFNSGNLIADGIRGFGLTLVEPSPGGRLRYQLYLRIYPWKHYEGVGDIEEFSAFGTIEVPHGDRLVNVQLGLPLMTTHPLQTHHRRVDIVLLFEGAGGGPLMLADEPTHELISPLSTVRTVT